MKEHKLTDWEAGNELAAITDFMYDKIEDLQRSHPEIHDAVDQKAREIGDLFNNLGAHDFGLRGTKDKSDA